MFDAIDRERGERVALKTVVSASPDLRLRFKNEFRSLQHIQHPNLVSLGELNEASGHLFFTMELVSGRSFLDHVRVLAPMDTETLTQVEAAVVEEKREAPASKLDEHRLRAALPQLASALVALHDAGKVHRDVKPSNVLVSMTGRVVLLDFGLITDALKPEHLVLGTPSYMAPEQALGRPVGPSADWYSVGVMLYRALTGEAPFPLRGYTYDKLLEKRAAIIPPGERQPSVPADLAALCMRLLAVEAGRRPTGREVLALLDDASPAPISAVGPAPPRELVGRQRERLQLDEAFEQARGGTAVVVSIEGESGLGKSTLLRAFVRAHEGAATTLTGRCYERVAVPFQAVDELMDAVGEALAHLPSREVDELLSGEVGRLAAAFPVLGLGRSRRPEQVRVSIDDSRSGTVVSGKRPAAPPAPSPEELDPIERRARLFAAARELFARLARRGPLVLAIEDIQWADADGLALLSEIVRPPEAPPLLLVFTRRVGEGSPRSLFAEDVEVRPIVLGAMSEEDSRALLSSMLESTGTDRREDDAALLREAGGHPWMLEALARDQLAPGTAKRATLSDIFAARVEALEPRAHALLEPIAVAGGPVLIDVIARVVATFDEEASLLIARLRADRLLRLSGAGRETRVALYHDRIRDAVLAPLPEEARRTWHRLLGEVLASTGRGRPDELAFHWTEAGETSLARPCAERAGDLSAERGAFDQAARHYGAALELGPLAGEETSRLATRLGEALVNAGRGREAGEAFLRAAAHAGQDAALDLQRRAAEAFLRAGYVDEGMKALRIVAAALDLPVPRSAPTMLGRLALGRVRLALSRDRNIEAPRSRDRRAELRADVCWSATTGLGVIYPLLSLHFQTLGLSLSQLTGDSYRMARAEALESAYLASVSGRIPEAALARTEELGRRAGSDHAMAVALACRGVALFSAGRVGAAIPWLDRASELLRERCTGVAWERGTATSYAIWGSWMAGDLGEVRRRLPIALREAEERGDRYLAANLRTSLGNTYWLLFDDDPARARSEADRAMAAWSQREGFHLQHLLDAEARLLADLYSGDPASAHRRIRAAWLPARAAMLFQVKHLRIFFTHLRVTTALSSTHGRASLGLLEAEWLVRKLEGEGAPWSSALALAGRAVLRARYGDSNGARAFFDEASTRLDREGFRAYAAAARLRRAELGGTHAEVEIERAEAWFRSHGVVVPRRAAALLIAPVRA